MSELRAGDALGAAIVAHLEAGDGGHVVERDDGWVRAEDAAVYFEPPKRWPEGELRLLERVVGRVLDVGAGAGRHALELQRRGHDVLALDTSAGAIEVCHRRGVAATFAGSIFELDDGRGFDTFLLAGHNLGLLGSPAAAPAFIARLVALARPGARMVGTSRHPTRTDDPDHLAYHDRNRAAGRPPGQLVIRVRRHLVASPWFDYWHLSPGELDGVVGPLGWRRSHTENVAGESSYLAVLVRA